MASMRGATRSRHTIHHVWTHFQVLHPSRSAHTHTTRSRDTARTTACSEPRQTSPSTMLIPSRTARSFECRGASSLSLRGFGLTTRRRAQQRALASTAPTMKAAHIGPYECTHVRTRTRTGVRSPARSGVGVRGRAVRAAARPPGGPPFPSARGLAPPVRPRVRPSRPTAGPPPTRPPRPARPARPVPTASPRPPPREMVSNAWRGLVYSWSTFSPPVFREAVPDQNTGNRRDVPDQDTMKTPVQVQCSQL